MKILIAVASTLCLIWAMVLGGGASPYDHPVDFSLDEVGAALDVSSTELIETRVSLRKMTEEPNVIVPGGRASLGFLIRPWIQADPDSAPGALSYLFHRIRGHALRARESSVYICATMRAADLLGVMLGLAPERARELARTWPEPEPEMERTAWNHYRHFWDQVRATALLEVAGGDVDRALKMVSQKTYCFSAAARGLMVVQMWGAGKKDEALTLARQVIRNYRENPVDSVVALDFSRFIEELAPFAARPLHRDLYREAWALGLEKAAGLDQSPTLLEGEDGTPVTFLPGEIWALDQLAELRRWEPADTRWFMSDLLEGFPDLKRRLERIGGLRGSWYLRTIQNPRYPGCCQMGVEYIQLPVQFSHVIDIPRGWAWPIEMRHP